MEMEGGAVPTVLFMGATGHGKSTIINKIKSPDETKNAEVTDRQLGTTKLPDFYKCTLPNGTKYIALDCSGVGDYDIPASWTMVFLQHLFGSDDDEQTGSANGLFVVSKIGENPNIGGKLLGEVCKKCIKGGFDNVAHVQTFADRYPVDEVAGEADKTIFETVFGSPPGHMLNTSKDYEDAQEFHAIVDQMTDTKLEWENATEQELAAIVADISGFRHDQERVVQQENEIRQLNEDLTAAKKKAKSLLSQGLKFARDVVMVVAPVVAIARMSAGAAI